MIRLKETALSSAAEPLVYEGYVPVIDIGKAFPADPEDRKLVGSAVDSCASTDSPRRHQPVTSGAYLQTKIELFNGWGG